MFMFIMPLCLVVSIWNGQSISNQPTIYTSYTQCTYSFVHKSDWPPNGCLFWMKNYQQLKYIYMYWFIQSLVNQWTKLELIHAFKCKQYLTMLSFRNSKFNTQIVHFQNIKFHTIPFFYDASFYLNGSITKSIFNRVNYHK